MPSIFISFRKVDNRWMRDRIYQALAEAFGANEIFKSGESIPAGGDFGAILRRQAAECKVMLVLIGTAWSDARDAGGGRLLDRQDDWVRVEIATALAAGNRVVPVLLGDAAMLPAPVALPEDVAELAQLQFLRVPEAHVDDGLQRLVTAMAGLMPELAASEADGTGPAAPTPAAVSAVAQDAGNAVAILGRARNVSGGPMNVRETKVHTGGFFATVTTFLTTKVGLIAAAAAVITTAATVAVTTSSGGGSGAAGAIPAIQADKAVRTPASPTGSTAGKQLSRAQLQLALLKRSELPMYFDTSYSNDIHYMGDFDALDSDSCRPLTNAVAFAPPSPGLPEASVDFWDQGMLQWASWQTVSLTSFPGTDAQTLFQQEKNALRTCTVVTAVTGDGCAGSSYDGGLEFQYLTQDVCVVRIGSTLASFYSAPKDMPAASDKKFNVSLRYDMVLQQLEKLDQVSQGLNPS